MKKLIALMLALVMVLALAACGAEQTPATDPAPATDPVDTTPADDTAKVLTYEEFVAIDISEGDVAVVVETAIQAYESWWDGEIDLYCQDENGAYYVYGVKCTEEEAKAFVPGAKVRVSGYKTAWDGEVEIVDAKVEVLEGTYIVESALDATALLGTDELAAEMNKKVAFKGLTVVASQVKDEDGNVTEHDYLYKWDGSGAQGDDLYFNVELNGNIYTFTVNAYMNGTGSDSEVYKAVEALKVGDKIDVEGFLYWYNGAQPHLTSVTPAA